MESNQTEILEKLNNIISRLDVIEQELRYLKTGNDNMNRHISFVESVYNYVKSPLFYIVNKMRPIKNVETPKAILDEVTNI
jgi:hypothetical protein